MSYSQYEIEIFYLLWMDDISFSWPCVSMASYLDFQLSFFNGTDVEKLHFGTDGSLFFFFISKNYFSKCGMQTKINLITFD